MEEPGGDSLESGTPDDQLARPLLPPPTPTDSPVEPDPEPVRDFVLPPAAAKPPPPMAPGLAGPAPTSATWYRSDQQRYRSVYRRANPWYRRLARGLIGLSIFAAVGVGVYFGIDLIRDYVNRDKLPSPGAEVAEFTQSAFLVHSEPPAPAVDGTLTIDLSSGAFQFVGGSNGPQENTELVSPDGTRIYVRSAGGAWRTAGDNDPVAGAVRSVIPFMTGVNGPDDVLVNRLRQGYIDLVDRTVVGTGEDAVSTYRMAIDTATFSSDYPLQWQAFQEEVVPNMAESSSSDVRMSIDSENVVVGLDAGPSWRWQRLTYSTVPLEPLDPAGSVASTAPPTTVGG